MFEERKLITPTGTFRNVAVFTGKSMQQLFIVKAMSYNNKIFHV